RRQTAHEHLRYTFRLQPISQTSCSSMSVVEETAVAINRRGRSFGKHFRDPIAPEVGRQLRALRSLNTMRGPKRLWQPVKLDVLEWLSSGMICGKAAVISRMPILCRDDEVKRFL